MEFKEEDFLMLSEIQHFKFCRRQWALIHIENQWVENFFTTDGTLMHENAHSKGFRESRGDVITTRGMSVFSRTLGVSGECDVVEFIRSEDGINLNNQIGLWQPYPVEYKRGSPKSNECDNLQLCGQAMCLEEMLCCNIMQGAIYYGEIRQRQVVTFTDELRQTVRECLFEMHNLHKRGHTPKVKPSKSCNACSMKDVCLPSLMGKRSVIDYLHKNMEDLQ